MRPRRLPPSSLPTAAVKSLACFPDQPQDPAVCHLHHFLPVFQLISLTQPVPPSAAPPSSSTLPFLPSTSVALVTSFYRSSCGCFCPWIFGRFLASPPRQLLQPSLPCNRNICRPCWSFLPQSSDSFKLFSRLLWLVCQAGQHVVSVPFVCFLHSFGLFFGGSICCQTALPAAPPSQLFCLLDWGLTLSIKKAPSTILLCQPPRIQAEGRGGWLVSLTSGHQSSLTNDLCILAECNCCSWMSTSLSTQPFRTP